MQENHAKRDIFLRILFSCYFDKNLYHKSSGDMIQVNNHIEDIFHIQQVSLFITLESLPKITLGPT